jgi:hypothetical protein
MGWAHCTMHGVVLVQGMRTNLCQQNARPGCQQAHTLKHTVCCFANGQTPTFMANASCTGHVAVMLRSSHGSVACTCHMIRYHGHTITLIRHAFHTL